MILINILNISSFSYGWRFSGPLYFCSASYTRVFLLAWLSFLGFSFSGCATTVKFNLADGPPLLVSALLLDRISPHAALPQPIQDILSKDFTSYGWSDIRWVDYNEIASPFISFRSTEQRIRYIKKMTPDAIAVDRSLDDASSPVLLIEILLERVPGQSGDLIRFAGKTRFSLSTTTNEIFQKELSQSVFLDSETAVKSQGLRAMLKTLRKAARLVSYDFYMWRRQRVPSKGQSGAS